AIFVNGCFWHGHECSLFKWPKTRQEFWTTKIIGNQERDRRVHAAMADLGWRVGVVWECSWKGAYKLSETERLQCCSIWLKSEQMRMELMEDNEFSTGASQRLF